MGPPSEAVRLLKPPSVVTSTAPRWLADSSSAQGSWSRGEHRQVQPLSGRVNREVGNNLASEEARFTLESARHTKQAVCMLCVRPGASPGRGDLASIWLHGSPVLSRVCDPRRTYEEAVARASGTRAGRSGRGGRLHG